MAKKDPLSQLLDSPLVSIVCITYNQDRFIAQALDSFLSQQCSFSFEVIVSDDCSTDKTTGIIETYAKAHPDVIKPVFHRHNIGSQQNFIKALQRTRGKYVALCDGDDYWIDNQKLQQQVDFMENHSTYALCFHPVKVIYDDKSHSDTTYPKPIPKSLTVTKLLQQNFIQTNSVLYRRKSYDNLPSNIMPMDWYLHLYHAKFGKIGFINKVMSVYRRHPGGIWWDSYRNTDGIWRKYGLEHLSLYIEILKLYGNNSNYKKILHSSIDSVLNAILAIDNKYGDKVLERAMVTYPDIVEQFVIDRENKNQLSQDHICNLENIIKSQEKDLSQKDQELTRLSQQLSDTIDTKLRKFIGKFIR